MNDCGMCGGPLDWSDHVGELDLRLWYIGTATADKFYTCLACWAKLAAVVVNARNARV
jgi:hypothetical protein